ncbi:MAG: stalk domain-containing protein [Defluviitaleaceae bacterium]|nr:stalk domain-containing protein [Defluviitaleaceae bacterium]
MKRFTAVFVSVLMLIGLMPVVALANDDIDVRNRGILWAPLDSASEQNPSWGGSFTHADDAFINFDVTVEGRHTLTLPPWPRTDDLWYQGASVMLLNPTGPTSAALPITIESISVNGVPRIMNRGFTAGGGFWNETAGTFFGDIELAGGARVTGIPGYSIQFFMIPDVVGAVELIPWLFAGTSELMGTIDAGDIMTVTILVGEPPEVRPGHVTGGDSITEADLELLELYIAAENKAAFLAENPQFNILNADLNGDGFINEEDVALLRAYLEGEDVDLGPAEWVKPTRPADPQLSDFPEGTRFIALTFDDGPNVTYTTQVLDELARFGATATFYVNPIHFSPSTLPVLYRAISEGHDVDNHSFNHTSFGADIIGSGFTFTTVEEAVDDLTRSSQAIFDVTGIWPFSFRAPFFEWGGANNILLGLDRYFNQPFVGTGMDTNDWQENRTPQDIADTVLNNADASGGIVLLHDTTQRAVDSLAIIIPEMQERGYAFVTVRQLMMLTGSMPELFGDSMRTGGNINAWAPVRRSDPVPFWPDYPNWWEQDWWTDETPPWESGVGGAGIMPPPYEPAIALPPVPPGMSILRLEIGSQSYILNGATGELDVAAASIGGRTMVPLRFIGDTLGAEVDWEPDTQTAIFIDGDTTIRVQIGEVLRDEDGVELGAAIIEGGRTLVPLRFVSESMGAEIDFNAETRAVYVTFATPGAVLPDPPPEGSPSGMVLRHTYAVDWGAMLISPGFSDGYYTVSFDILHSRANAPFISVQPNLQQPDGGWSFTDADGQMAGVLFAPAGVWNHLTFTFSGSQTNGDLSFATEWPRVVDSSFYIDNIVITNAAGDVIYSNDFEDGIGGAGATAYSNGIVEVVPVP